MHALICLRFSVPASRHCHFKCTINTILYMFTCLHAYMLSLCILSHLWSPGLCSWCGLKHPPTPWWRWSTSRPVLTWSTSTTKTSWWSWTTPSCRPISRWEWLTVHFALCRLCNCSLITSCNQIPVHVGITQRLINSFVSCTFSAPWLWELISACARPPNTWMVGKAHFPVLTLRYHLIKTFPYLIHIICRAFEWIHFLNTKDFLPIVSK